MHRNPSDILEVTSCPSLRGLHFLKRADKHILVFFHMVCISRLVDWEVKGRIRTKKAEQLSYIMHRYREKYKY